MRVLLLHNRYQQRGGEDQVVDNELALLQSPEAKALGIEVSAAFRDNTAISEGPLAALKVATSLFHSDAAIAWAAEMKNQFHPDVVHIHNFFPLITPSVHQYFHSHKIPVIQTLHNFRLQCSNALFLRNGKVCEKCLHGTPIWGAVHGCYRESHVGSLAVAKMIRDIKVSAFYSDWVTRFVVLTEFAKKKNIEGGVPSEKIIVKPNFAEVPSNIRRTRELCSGGKIRFIYIGRFSEEKGIQNLAEVLKKLSADQDTQKMEFHFVGDGPLLNSVTTAAKSSTVATSFHGRRSHEETLQLLADSDVLVLPSICYEGFPVVLAEALALGVPSVVSNIGGPPTIIQDGKTGWHAHAGSASHLIETLLNIVRSPNLIVQSSEQCLISVKEFSKTTALRNLVEIYQQVSG